MAVATMDDGTIQETVKRLVLEHNDHALNHFISDLVTKTIFTNTEIDVQHMLDVATRALASAVAHADHATQQYWLGECNCDGHLN